ncbi:MAG: glycosyltransferase family 2 protein [Gammaproteobacteria bacterium]|nr:glycosyltransferase family 2 protein [Pseudomonadales bacterium]MCP5345585.1 glycosyltransferase family 2 protein [Pseudomonadales bacterium]
MTVGELTVSVVIPAKNEARNLELMLPKLLSSGEFLECIVVNDGSSDDTVAVCEANGVTVITNPYSKGNGSAIKTGAKAARGDIIVFLDGDGQHRPEDIPRLLEKMTEGFDMVVGARGRKSQADSYRAIANGIYNRLASWMTGQKVDDLTSGFRVVRANRFREFLYLLPNGFSYPTTCTMAFFRSGYSVGYVSVETERRLGDSHISLLKDGIRFLIIIFKVGTLYSPLKIFFPVAAGFFATGICYYLYTLTTQGRFTNMSAVLFMTSVLVFLIGLVSEQVTTLMYKDADR